MPIQWESLPAVTLLLRVHGNSEVELAALERRRALDEKLAALVRAAAAALVQTAGMVLLLVAAFAPVPAVWVLVLYGAGMAAAAAGVLVQRRRVRR